MFEYRNIKPVIICCVFSLLSACSGLENKRGANLPPVMVVSQQAARPSDTEREALTWLAAYRTQSSASAEEQRREYQAAQAAVGKEFSDSNRLRLAVALSLPGAPWRDDNMLMKVLDTPPSLLKQPDSSINQLAFLLYKQAQERQRLREEPRKRESDLLDEQKRLREEQKRRDAELIEAQRRNDELQMKLDALRRIDQEIKHRKNGLDNTP